MYAKDGVTSTTLSACKEVVVLYQRHFISCELVWEMNRKCPQIIAVHKYRLSRQHWLITLIDFDTILSQPSFHILLLNYNTMILDTILCHELTKT